MGFFDRFRRKRDKDLIKPVIADVHHKPKRMGDRHKKERVTLRLEPHIKLGIKDYCFKNDYNLAEFTSMFYVTILYGDSRTKLRKMIEKNHNNSV